MGGGCHSQHGGRRRGEQRGEEEQRSARRRQAKLVYLSFVSGTFLETEGAGAISMSSASIRLVDGCIFTVHIPGYVPFFGVCRFLETRIGRKKKGEKNNEGNNISVLCNSLFQSASQPGSARSSSYEPAPRAACACVCEGFVVLL